MPLSSLPVRGGSWIKPVQRVSSAAVAGYSGTGGASVMITTRPEASIVTRPSSLAVARTGSCCHGWSVCLGRAVGLARDVWLRVGDGLAATLVGLAVGSAVDCSAAGVEERAGVADVVPDADPAEPSMARGTCHRTAPISTTHKTATTLGAQRRAVRAGMDLAFGGSDMARL